MYNSGHARHRVPTTLRGAETEAFAVATAAVGSCRAVATLATAAAAAAASAAAWRLRRRALRVEGPRREGAVSKAENVLPVEASILFASGTGSPEQSSVGTAYYSLQVKISQCDLNGIH